MSLMRRNEETHLQVAYAAIKGVILNNDLPELYRIIHMAIPVEQIRVLYGIDRVRKFFLILEPKETPRIEIHLVNTMGHDMVLYLTSTVCPPAPGISKLPTRKMIGSVFVEKLAREKVVQALEQLIDEDQENSLKELKPVSFSDMMGRFASADN